MSNVTFSSEGNYFSCNERIIYFFSSFVSKQKNLLRWRKKYDLKNFAFCPCIDTQYLDVLDHLLSSDLKKKNAIWVLYAVSNLPTNEFKVISKVHKRKIERLVKCLPSLAIENVFEEKRFGLYSRTEFLPNFVYWVVISKIVGTSTETELLKRRIHEVFYSDGLFSTFSDKKEYDLLNNVLVIRWGFNPEVDSLFECLKPLLAKENDTVKLAKYCEICFDHGRIEDGDTVLDMLCELFDEKGGLVERKSSRLINKSLSLSYELQNVLTTRQFLVNKLLKEIH